MRSILGIFLILSAALFLGINTLSKKSSSLNDDSYHVVLAVLPEKNNPHTNDVNIFNYINLHLYYPLISIDQEGARSEYLNLSRSRALDSSFDKFQFCLKDGLLFEDGSVVLPTHLESSIRAVHKRKLSLPEIIESSLSDQCLTVRLSEAIPNYFNHLTDIQSAVVKDIKGNKIGIGPYKLELLTHDKITLTRRSEATSAFGKIVFHKYNKKLLEISDEYVDWNHLYYSPTPDRSDDTHFTIDKPSLRVYTVFNNIQNPTDRMYLVKCLDLDLIASSIGLKLAPTQGILPNGIFGSVPIESSESEYKASDCESDPGQSQSYTFFNHIRAADKALAAYLNVFNKSSRVKLQLKNISSPEAKDLFFSPESRFKEYVSILGLDGMVSDPFEYFTGFFETNPLELMVARPVSGLRSTLSSARYTFEHSRRNDLFSKSHRMLLDSNYLFPLGQFVATQTYSSKLKNIVYFDRMNLFPVIHEMRVND